MDPQPAQQVRVCVWLTQAAVQPNLSGLHLNIGTGPYHLIPRCQLAYPHASRSGLTSAAGITPACGGKPPPTLPAELI